MVNKSIAISIPSRKIIDPKNCQKSRRKINERVSINERIIDRESGVIGTNSKLLVENNVK
jgi:hypothetical protein